MWRIFYRNAILRRQGSQTPAFELPGIAGGFFPNHRALTIYPKSFSPKRVTCDTPLFDTEGKVGVRSTLLPLLISQTCEKFEIHNFVFRKWFCVILIVSCIIEMPGIHSKHWFNRFLNLNCVIAQTCNLIIQKSDIFQKRELIMKDIRMHQRQMFFFHQWRSLTNSGISFL